jgi:hypothetical protein
MTAMTAVMMTTRVTVTRGAGKVEQVQNDAGDIELVLCPDKTQHVL